MRLTIPPESSPPVLSELREAIGRLRAELEHTEDTAQQAGLLYELGVLNEMARDDHSAARDLLAAINKDGSLREPLEQLIAVIERRKSFKNLHKLLDRLGRIANSEQELVRAQLARGNFLTDHGAQPEQAKAAYELALKNDPKRATGWLFLQALAGKLKDGDLEHRALAARAELAEDSSYRAFLRMSLARLSTSLGRGESASVSLELAANDGGRARFFALQELERQARESNETALIASSLETQAAIISQSLDSPEHADKNGVPYALRGADAAVDAWLRAGLAQYAARDAPNAIKYVERACELSQAPELRRVLLALVESHGDTERAAKLAHGLLGDTTVASERSALMLRQASAAIAKNNLGEALDCLEETLKTAPTDLVAQAMQLNLLGQTKKPERLAAAIETLAEQVPEGSAQARLYLLASFVWGRDARDSSAARVALSQATMAGLDGLTAARAARLVAGLNGDMVWQRDATRRVTRSGDSEERASALAELVRSSWLLDGPEVAQKHTDELIRHPDGQWLGCVLGAYGSRIPSTRAENGPSRAEANETTDHPKPPASNPTTAADSVSLSALETLAELETDAEIQSALRQILSLRQRRSGDGASAVKTLRRLQSEHGTDLLSTYQLSLALQTIGERDAAAKLLEQSASAESTDVQLPLRLEAGILHWLADEREESMRCFELSETAQEGSSGGLRHWSLRAARPDAPEARRLSLEAGLKHDGDADIYALERFALEVGFKAQHEDATRALDSEDSLTLGEVGDAVQLARALWPDAHGHTEACDELEKRSQVGLEIGKALKFLDAQQEPRQGPELLEQMAANWAETGSIESLLEWLASSVHAKNVDAEVKAREALATRLEGRTRASLKASAAIVSFLAKDFRPPLLEESTPEARLTNLELTQPGEDPRRRSSALSGVHDTLGEENEPLLLMMAGYNELATEQFEAARATFRAVAENFPEDISAWEGLRMAAAGLNELALEADACTRIGALASDSRQAARAYRRAATLLLDQLEDSQAGYDALEHAVRLDIRNRGAFERLFRHHRKQRKHHRVLELCSARLNVTDDSAEVTKMYWERARAYRALNQPDAALGELESVRLLEPKHVGSMALSGEIYITQGRLENAAAELANLAAHPDAPDEQRLMSGVAAVDLYEGKLGQLEQALQVLFTLQQAGLATLEVRERLAHAAAKAARWSDAVKLLEQLMSERDTSEGRIEAARLALAIYRDQQGDPTSALTALRRLLLEAPSDAEALDLLLEGEFDETDAKPLLQSARDALVAELSDTEVDAERVARLARIAEHLDALPLRQVTLGALVTLGVNSLEVRNELQTLDARAPRHPQIAISEEQTRFILHPDDQGPLPELMRLLAPALAEILGPELKFYGVGRRHRVKTQTAFELRSEIAAWGGALGLGDFELYVGGDDPYGIAAVPSVKSPAFVIGQNVSSPPETAQRQSIAKQVLALVRGSTLLLNRDPVDVAALLVAACKVGDVEIESPPFALTGDFERLLSKQLPRKLKKQLPDMAHLVKRSKQDPLAWAHAAVASLDRVAALAVGDVSWVVLKRVERESGEREFDPRAERRENELLQFVLSPRFLQLRTELGMAVK